MPACIALLRGVNVGGNRLVSMSVLRGLLSDLGLGNPQSLLQSGNLVFEAGGPAAAIERRLEQEAASRLGLATDFMVRSAADWRRVISRNPFPEMASADPAHLVVVFLKRAPRPAAVVALRDSIDGRERLACDGRQLYVTYPDGIGTSRLNGIVIERTLGTRGTARNWNTVLKLAAMLPAVPRGAHNARR